MKFTINVDMVQPDQSPQVSIRGRVLRPKEQTLILMMDGRKWKAFEGYEVSVDNGMIEIVYAPIDSDMPVDELYFELIKASAFLACMEE